MPRQTPHQRAEAELTQYGLSFPETDAAPGWTVTRCLRVRKKMFAVFGETGETLDALTLIFKLPISAEMAQTLSFVRESRGWYKQHNWVIAHFGPADDILAEMETLRAWLKQSYLAMAPKKLAKLVMAQTSESEGAFPLPRSGGGTKGGGA
jgi:YjbR